MDANTIQIITSACAGSGVVVVIINAFLNRNKNKAELQDIIGKVYGDMIEDCRNQLSHQANQLQAMQGREVEYLRIIREQQQTERELRTQIRTLETKLNKRISKIEEQNESTL